MAAPDYSEQSQQTTIASGTSETTIVTADPNFRRNLTRLIVTTPNTAAATLTLRDATGVTDVALFAYTGAASGPTALLVINFAPPLRQKASNNNLDRQGSAAAAAVHITADFVVGS